MTDWSILKDLPRDIVNPWLELHCYGEYRRADVMQNYTDNDGLLTDDNPCGKKYTMSDSLGLRAEILVKERIMPYGKINEDYIEYTGEGYIEGYTAMSEERNSDITVCVYKGEICEIRYMAGDEDMKAYESFPLWQPYFKWEREQQRLEGDRGFIGTI